RAVAGGVPCLLRCRKRRPLSREELHLSGHADPQERNEHYGRPHWRTPGAAPLACDDGVTVAGGGPIRITESFCEAFVPSRKITGTPDFSNGLRESGS